MDNVTVQCHAPSVIIRTVAAEEISPSVSQAELTVDSEIQPVDLVGPATSLEADAFPDDLPQPKLADEGQSAYSEDNASKFVGGSSANLINRVTARAGEQVLDADLKCEEDACQSHFASTYVSEDLGSPTTEEPVEQSTMDETVLIVPSPHGFIQTSDDMDSESVLPLTTLTDPILQHHGENSHIIGSSLDSPDSEDSKDVEDLVSCH
ncbi:UNVERIFIED_CONTAM: hypothetical protein K2H54_002934 [Gekko kuhli]